MVFDQGPLRPIHCSLHQPEYTNRGQACTAQKMFSREHLIKLFYITCLVAGLFMVLPLQDDRLKKSFAALFKVTCPTLVSTRWGYLCLHWKQYFCFRFEARLVMYFFQRKRITSQRSSKGNQHHESGSKCLTG